MKKLLFLLLFAFHLTSFGQINLDKIPPKIVQEYVIFDMNKFDNELLNLTQFGNSLTKLDSWYKKKQGLKGDIGASISNKLSRNKEEEDLMIKFALAVINFDERITQSIIKGDGDDYQNKLNKLISKTQKGKVTPELGQIIYIIRQSVETSLSNLRVIDKSYRNILKKKLLKDDFDNIFKTNSENTFNFMKVYIDTETVEEDNPVYVEALKKKKEEEMLASLPHQTYSGKYGYNAGTATYSYLETEDGRIFDGKWVYKESLGTTTFTSEGQYKRDIRCGKWVWTYKHDGKIDHVQIFNFDDNGFLHGEVIYDTPGKPKLCYKVYYNHGILIGKYTNVWNCIKYGYYNTLELNEKGKLIGTAVYVKPSTSMIYYQNDEKKEMYTVNDQTGEKRKGGMNILDDFERFIGSVMLSSPATWLNTNNISPDRKSPSYFIEH